MDIKRTVLWVIFFMSAVMLFDNWQRDHGRPSMFFPSATPPQTAASAAPGTTPPRTPPADLPATNPSAPGAAPAAQAQLIPFTTDVYSGEIDTRGGTLSKLSLINKGNGKQPDLVITLFDHTADHTYLARTGLLGGDFPNHTDVFTPVPGQATDMTGNTLKLSFESPERGGL